MMRVGGGIAYRYQKILEVKSVEPMPEESDSDESEDLQKFTNFNDRLIQKLIENPLPTSQSPPEIQNEIEQEKEKKRKRKKKNKSKKNKLK